MQPPSAGLWRATGALVAVATLATLGLSFFPVAAVILVFAAWPGLVAFLLCGGHRATYERNAAVASFAGGATGAIWLGVMDTGEARAPAVIVGAFISFVLLTLLAAAFAWLFGRWLERRNFGA